MSRTLENNHIEFRNKIFSCFAVIAVFGRGDVLSSTLYIRFLALCP